MFFSYLIYKVLINVSTGFIYDDCVINNRAPSSLNNSALIPDTRNLDLDPSWNHMCALWQLYWWQVPVIERVFQHNDSPCVWRVPQRIFSVASNQRSWKGCQGTASPLCMSRCRRLWSNLVWLRISNTAIIKLLDARTVRQVRVDSGVFCWMLVQRCFVLSWSIGRTQNLQFQSGCSR